MNNIEILLRHNLIEVPKNRRKTKADTAMLGTLISNIRYYGYVPSKEVLTILSTSTDETLSSVWTKLENSLKAVTGANRKMEKFVVYKNFPKEVLDMSAAQYWVSQILMYWGLPNELFTQEETDRPALFEKSDLKVLHLAGTNAIGDIIQSIKNSSSRWSDNQDAYAKYFVNNNMMNDINVSEFKFRENAISMISQTLNSNTADIKVTTTGVKVGNLFSFKIDDATDVLRLAAGMSAGDIALREKIRFKKFSRSTRRMFVGILGNTKNLVDDFAMRPELWKTFLKFVHPNEFGNKRVSDAYDKLYRKDYVTFASQITPQVKHVKMLEVIKQRPGEFVRRLHDMYNNFGTKAVTAFVSVVPQLKTDQLVKVMKYIETINDRSTLMHPPKGNWSRVKTVPNEKKKFTLKDKTALLKAIDNEISARMNKMFPDGVRLDDNVNNIKLQTNDQKLAEYGRGTTFDIPANIKFIRSASYWQQKSHGNTWFDNGWNFFDGDWGSIDTCSWNNYSVGYGSDAAAIFSGDPTNSKDLKGRACQMIDLYPEKLKTMGIRYAVWNVLCFSRITFDQADDVLATLQMGESAEKGKLYEPSRAQIVFPLKSKTFSSYVAYLDLVENKIVYMDAPLKADTTSATRNGKMLQTVMPAYLEYLKSLPTVYDLFANVKKGKTPILYTDKDVTFKNKKAYVFSPKNEKNKFENIKLQSLIV